jgi:Helix-turn-helix domain of transposase family ISL3
VFTGDRQVLLDWRKTRWHCDTPGCEQGTFTEWLPAVKRRARLTSRLRTCLGEAVGDDLTPATAAARRYGVSDRTAARAFTAYADEQLAGLDERQDPVQAAGVDEFRRGAPADRTDPETGEVTRTRSGSHGSQLPSVTYRCQQDDSRLGASPAARRHGQLEARKAGSARTARRRWASAARQQFKLKLVTRFFNLSC